MKTRPNFECCQCGRTFGQLVDLERKPVLLVECPFCHAECKVDMVPYRQRVTTIWRGNDAVPSAARYDLTDTVPTFKLGGEESGEKA